MTELRASQHDKLHLSGVPLRNRRREYAPAWYVRAELLRSEEHHHAVEKLPAHGVGAATIAADTMRTIGSGR